jgi:hypothetical protein
MVIGRYGTAVPLARDPVSIPAGLPATGIEIRTTRITHSVVKVSWPFYPGYQWTATKRFYNPDLAFVVTRVSDTHILLSRVDELSFANGPENTNSSTCWKLMAGDTLINLTKTCTPPKADAACASGRDTCEIESEFVVSAKVEKMPDNVVLVAPSGSYASKVGANLWGSGAYLAWRVPDVDASAEPAAAGKIDWPSLVKLAARVAVPAVASQLNPTERIVLGQVASVVKRVMLAKSFASDADREKPLANRVQAKI